MDAFYKNYNQNIYSILPNLHGFRSDADVPTTIGSFMTIFSMLSPSQLKVLLYQRAGLRQRMPQTRLLFIPTGLSNQSSKPSGMILQTSDGDNIDATPPGVGINTCAGKHYEKRRRVHPVGIYFRPMDLEVFRFSIEIRRLAKYFSDSWRKIFPMIGVPLLRQMDFASDTPWEYTRLGTYSPSVCTIPEVSF